MTPVFVLHPVPVDLETRRPKTSREVHLDKLAGQLLDVWGMRPAFVDTRWLGCDSPLSAGGHVTERFVSDCADRGLPLSPIVTPRDTPECFAAALRACQAADTAPCFRLAPSDWSDIGTPTGDGRLLGMLAKTGLGASQVHLILDFEDQLADTIALSAAAIRPVLVNLPKAYEWASVTVAGTGMPTGTAEVGRNATSTLPRLEWQLWQLLDGATHRRPSFGDYGVQNPDPASGFDPRIMDSAAQLRYTLSEDWLIVRGEGVKRSGTEQMRGLAGQVVANRAFSGPSASWGDTWLHNCSTGACSPGSQAIWRKVTTNHHLSFVVHQLANVCGP